MIEGAIRKIEAEEMTLSYKMVLLVAMCDLADEQGRTLLTRVAEWFKEFFSDRAARGKLPENPKVFKNEPVSTRSREEWERVIRDEPLRRISRDLLVEDGNAVVWATDIRANWDSLARKRLRTAAWSRLQDYFDKHVPGGF